MSSEKGITLGELTKRLKAKLVGDPQKEVFGINTLKNASADEISFLSRSSYIKDLKSTLACAVIISEDQASLASCDVIVGTDPYLLYAKCTKIFKDLEKNKVMKGISEKAEISSSARVNPSACIGPFCQIGDNVEIGEGVSLGSGIKIYDATKIGNGTKIYSNSTIYHSVIIGRNCIVHSGTVIGSDGFGFAREKDNWVKIEHLGKVIIGDNVEIGSNCSIDRGSLGDTFINDEVKIDNQVHLAHNVNIGRATAIAANTAIAGSTSVGKNCTISGGCGIIDNLKITDSVNITAHSLVTKSINKSGTYTSGTVLMEHNLWKRNAIAFKKLKDFIKK